MFLRLALAGGIIALTISSAPAVARTQATDAPEGCAWTGSTQPGYLTCQSADGRTDTFRAPYGFDADTVAKTRAGDPEALWLMAILYSHGEPELNPKLQAEWMAKAAEAGNLPAMSLLASRLIEGNSLPMDKAAGVRWLRAAADRGWPSAMGHLGYLYAVGDGVPKDDAEAARWFRAAAEAGDANAMSNLAVSYSKGLGVPRDWAEAARWRKRSVEVGLRAAGPSWEDMLLSYPVEAAAAHIQATVMLRCELDIALFVTKCGIESEEPTGWGFGPAALKLSTKIQMKPGLRPGANIRVPMPFELSTPPEPREVVDQCAAYAIALEREQPFTGATQWWSRYWLARSRLLARQAGAPEDVERLEPQITVAADRLAKGKERGLFGKVGRCYLTR